jgi:hypothetical protein
VSRVRRVFATLDRDQRLTAVAALVLLLTLFLPWYDTSVAQDDRFIHESYNGFGSADFTLASVVLVAIGVLGLLWTRGEERGFHLPFGDGIVIMAAGGWACLLIFFRVVVHPDLGGSGARVGIQWGVFIAFLAAAFLIYCGFRIHTSRLAEPPLPKDVQPPARRPRTPAPAPMEETGPTIAVDLPADRPPRRRGERPRRDYPTEVEPPPLPEPKPAADPPTVRQRPRRPRDGGGGNDDGQLSFDEPKTRRMPDGRQ